MKKDKAKKAKTDDLYLALIVDRSGSMNSCHDATISAFNEYLQDRVRDAGKTTAWLTLFWAPGAGKPGMERRCEGVPVSDVPLFTRENYVPAGNTALYDAIGATVRGMEARIKADGYTGKVLVVIQTDGAENSSREWTREQIFALREEMEAKGNWTFVFLGTDIDAYGAGAAIGVAAGNTAAYAAASSVQTMSNLSEDTRNYRAQAVGQSASLVSNATRRAGGDATVIPEPEKEPTLRTPRKRKA